MPFGGGAPAPAPSAPRSRCGFGRAAAAAAAWRPLSDPVASAQLWSAVFALLALLSSSAGPSAASIAAAAGMGGCAPGAAGALLPAPRGSAFIASCGSAANLVCLGVCVGALVFFAGAYGGSASASAANGAHTNNIRRPALVVSCTIMTMSVTKYAIVAAGAAQVACFGRAQHVFVLLQYAYWLSAAPPMMVMFMLMGGRGEEQRARGGLATAAMVLLGYLSAQTQALPGAAWRAFSAACFALSCVLYALMAWYAGEALGGARVTSVDAATRRLLGFVVPLSAVCWALFPLAALLVRLGFVSPSLEDAAWPPLETSTKTSMCLLWLAGDYGRLELEVQQQLRVVEQERVVTDGRASAFRRFMRYIFHELRVPLNAIMLGVNECSEEVADLRAAIADIKASLVADGSDGGEGGGSELPLALAALARAVEAVQGRLGEGSLEPPLPQAMEALASAAASTVRLGAREPLPQALASLASAIASAHSLAAVLETVADNAAAMNKLLDDFLALEKFQEGKVELEVSAIDVASFLRSTASLFAAVFAAKQIRLRIEVRADAPAVFVGDANRLRQVLSNLLSNSVKFVRHGGTIVVRVAPQRRLRGRGGTRGELGLRAESGGAAGESNGGHSSGSGRGSGSNGSGGGGSGGSGSNNNGNGNGRAASLAAAAKLLLARSSLLGGSPAGGGPVAHSDASNTAAPTEASASSSERSETDVPVLSESDNEEPPQAGVVVAHGIVPPGTASEADSALQPGDSGHGLRRRGAPASAPAAAVAEAEALPPEEARFLRFSVLDNGPGISKEDQGQLFAPFVQIKAGALQKGNGTGLGLSICKHIVELSGGRIGVHSREGHGSSFFFVVPRDCSALALEHSDAAHSRQLASEAAARAAALSASKAAAVAASQAAAKAAALEVLQAAACAAAQTAACKATLSAAEASTLAAASTTAQTAAQAAAHAAAQTARFAAEAEAVVARLGAAGTTVQTAAQVAVPAAAQTAARFAAETEAEATRLPMISRMPAPMPAPTPALASAPSPMNLPAPAPAQFPAPTPAPEAAPASAAAASAAAEGVTERVPAPPTPAAAPVPALATAPAAAPAAAHGTLPLLSCAVVDDIESNRVLLGRLLTRRGVATVLYACDGAEALRLLDGAAGQQVQVVFLDKEMPVMDGHACAERLRSSGPPSLRIIGVTGNAMESDKRAFVAAGADSVVSKPVDVAVLEKALAALGLHLAPARGRAGGASLLGGGGGPGGGGPSGLQAAVGGGPQAAAGGGPLP